MKTRREKIMDRVDDLVGFLLYYDRKDDDDLPRGEIEAAVAAGEITMDEIAARFSTKLKARH